MSCSIRDPSPRDFSVMTLVAGKNKNQNCCIQSHYIEVAQGAIFKEQNMRFGLILGLLAKLLKNGANYEQLFRIVFLCFCGQFFLIQKWFTLNSVPPKKLNNISYVCITCFHENKTKIFWIIMKFGSIRIIWVLFVCSLFFFVKLM